MIEIGATYKLKDRSDSWGGLNIQQLLNDGRYYVVEYTEPITRRVLEEYDILHNWEYYHGVVKVND